MNGITCALTGRLPKDAGELRYTANGRAFLTRVPVVEVEATIERDWSGTPLDPTVAEEAR